MRLLWNDGWQFVKLPLGSSYEKMARADKRDVILPHDFLIENADDLYESCDGWYVKRLDWAEEYAGKRVFLDFDGVYMDADILLDGQVFLTHRYGYTAFRVEVPAADHEVALHIRHQSPNSRW